jgi:anti-sigma B factor antagonist
MTAQSIQARVVGSTAVVALEGELDRAQAARVRPRLLEAAAPDTVALLLDLAAVTYLDSAGVHLLLDLDRELRRRGQALHLVRPQRRTPAYVLEITGIGEGITVHADRDAAMVVVEPEEA